MSVREKTCSKHIKVLILSSLFFVALASTNIIGFQKYSLFATTNSMPNYQFSTSKMSVENLIREIPYKGQLNMYPLVNPVENFNSSINNGLGNCSEFVNGFAYFLGEKGVDYEIIHFLPMEGFTEGKGHTVIRTLIGGNIVALVDIQHGSVLVEASGEIASFEDEIVVKSLETLILKPLNEYHSYKSIVDVVDIVNTNYFIGRILPDENNRYNKFLRFVHFDLFTGSIDRLFFKGLSLFLGVAPNIYIKKDVFNMMKVEILFYKFILWCLRISFLLLIAMLIKQAYLKIMIKITNNNT